jgi:hypothetical protein
VFFSYLRGSRIWEELATVPLSSAIRKEHPFGCSFLIYEVA